VTEWDWLIWMDLATYHPLTITRHHPNDARTQEKELADKVVTQLMSSKVDEELESFFNLVGKELYKVIDPIEEIPFYTCVTGWRLWHVAK
jgi:hypothetical protein